MLLIQSMNFIRINNMSNIYIHPTAEVSDSAVIGEGTKIWNQAQVRNNVEIGENCIISKNVYIDEHVKIGNRVKVQNNVNVYHGVTVEDEVFLGPSMTFTNDMFPRACNSEWEICDTLVRKGASIGANCTIRCGVRINEYAMVGCGSVVTKDVPAHALVVGNPAKRIAWVCQCGQKLDNHFSCPKCGKQYELGKGYLQTKSE